MTPIGTIFTPFKKLDDMPIQPGGGSGVSGLIEINEKFRSGLADLDGFSHIYLIYRFHLAQRTEMEVVPFLDTQKRGVYATRSPLRPNHIGLSIVELVKIEGTTLTIKNLDILDGTPLLDIKPYIADFDQVSTSRSGWMTADKDIVAGHRSDKRFV